MAGAAGLLKRITLELGGNDAGIVLDDVNPKEAAQKLFDSVPKQRPVCIAMKRSMHENIYDEVCEELAIAMTPLSATALNRHKLQLLNNKMQYDKVKALIEDAKRWQCHCWRRVFGQARLLHPSDHRA